MLKGIIMQLLMQGVMAPIGAKTRVRGFLFVVAAVLILVATGFLVMAAHYWFSSRYTPELATLMSAGLVFGIACLCLIVAWIIGMRQKSYLRRMQKDMQDNLKGVMEILDDSVGQNVREHPVVSLLIAGMAGYALTDFTT